MGKEHTIRVRIDDVEAEALNALEKKYNVTKSQIIREGIKNFESIRENRIYPLRINRVLEALGKEYTIDSCGILGNDILLGKGLRIDLHADYSLSEPKHIEYGNCRIIMKGNKIHIEGGFLDDINKGLLLLHKSRKKGGGSMSYFSISDDNDNVKSYVLTSYEIETQDNNVLVSFNSVNYNVTYKLRPDARFKTVESIKIFLKKLLAKVISASYTLKISEFSQRMYVTIGYETDNEYVSEQFTGSKY